MKRCWNKFANSLKKSLPLSKCSTLVPKTMSKRDLMLIKVKASPGRARSEVRELVDIFRGKIVRCRRGRDHDRDLRTREHKIDAFIERMRTYASWNWCERRVALVRGASFGQESESLATMARRIDHSSDYQPLSITGLG